MRRVSGSSSTISTSQPSATPPATALPSSPGRGHARPRWVSCSDGEGLRHQRDPAQIESAGGAGRRSPPGSRGGGVPACGRAPGTRAAHARTSTPRRPHSRCPAPPARAFSRRASATTSSTLVVPPAARPDAAAVRAQQALPRPRRTRPPRPGRPPGCPRRLPCLRPRRTSAVSRLGARSVKQEPSPGRLRTVRSPPMSRANLRLMVSPRPVPPSRRVCLSSTCMNGSNTRSSCSGAIPIPVSSTSTRDPRTVPLRSGPGCVPRQ